MINLPEHKQLILFDGICNLCNQTVLYVIRHDRKNLFMFAPLQSEVGKQIIEHYRIDTSKVDSILLYSNKTGLRYKSTAALHIAKHLGFPHNLWSTFLILPTSIRNWGYDFIAKNRYKWFGKKETCMIPTPELKSKFLS